MNNRYPQTPGMNSSPGIPRDYQYGLTPIPTSNPLHPSGSGVGFAPNISASSYPSAAFTSDNSSNSSYPAASPSYLLVPNNPYLVFTSPYPASTSHYPASSNSPYPASASTFLSSSNICYPTSCDSPHPVPTSAHPSRSNRQYPASTSSYLATSYPAPASTNQSPGAFPYPPMGSRAYDSKFRPNIMNNRYPQTQGMNPPLGIPRDYPYGPTPMPASNPLYPSGVGCAPNMSASPYPSTAFTPGNPSNNSYPASSSLYLIAPNNPYPVISNNLYPASYSSLYPASASPYLATSNSHYLASSMSPYRYSSNRHYPEFYSSYPGLALMNQLPGTPPYPSMGSRGYDSKFEASVNEANDDALNINALPNEIILKVFSYLTQNKLGQIARVCRRWNVLTKSPVLWKKVNVRIFSSDRKNNTVAESFINGLSSCVTFIRLDFSECEDRIHTDFEKLCVKLHQNCPQLEELILTNLIISNLLPEVINFSTRFLQCIKKLVFRYCGFSNCSRTVELNDNSKIEVLDLYCCYIPHFSKTQLSKLLYLKELRLSYTDVDATWSDTSFLSQLHVLDLRHTQITASTFLAIQRYGHNLKELYLCWFKLQDHDLNFNNYVFPHLRTICLSCTPVTCEDVVSLIQSCPSLENVYVGKRVAEYFATHPFVLANRCMSGIVKTIYLIHDHIVDYLHN